MDQVGVDLLKKELVEAVPLDDEVPLLGLHLLVVEVEPSPVVGADVPVEADGEYPFCAHDDGDAHQEHRDGPAVGLDDPVDDAEVIEGVVEVEGLVGTGRVFADHLLGDVLPDHEGRVHGDGVDVVGEALLVVEGMVVGGEEAREVVGAQDDGVMLFDEGLYPGPVLLQGGAVGEDKELPPLMAVHVGDPAVHVPFRRLGSFGFGRRLPFVLCAAYHAAFDDVVQDLLREPHGVDLSYDLQGAPDVLHGILPVVDEGLRVVGVALEDAREHIGELVAPGLVGFDVHEEPVDGVEDRDHVVLVRRGELEVGEEDLGGEVPCAPAHPVDRGVHDVDAALDRLQGVCEGHLEAVVGVEPHLDVFQFLEGLDEGAHPVGEDRAVAVGDVDVVDGGAFEEGDQLRYLLLRVACDPHGLEGDEKALLLDSLKLPDRVKGAVLVDGYPDHAHVLPVVVGDVVRVKLAEIAHDGDLCPVYPLHHVLEVLDIGEPPGAVYVPLEVLLGAAEADLHDVDPRLRERAVDLADHLLVEMPVVEVPAVADGAVKDLIVQAHTFSSPFSL